MPRYVGYQSRTYISLYIWDLYLMWDIRTARGMYMWCMYQCHPYIITSPLPSDALFWVGQGSRVRHSSAGRSAQEWHQFWEPRNAFWALLNDVEACAQGMPSVYVMHVESFSILSQTLHSNRMLCMIFPWWFFIPSANLWMNAVSKALLS